jgi:uncharacterized protein (TIGR01370 family)
MVKPSSCRLRCLAVLSLLFLLIPYSVLAAKQNLEQTSKWLILLNPQQDPAILIQKLAERMPEMVILDGDHHPALSGFSTSTVRLAYLSIGEAESYRPYWAAISSATFFVETNKDWSGNVRVDFRDPRWQAILLKQEIPRYLAQGFQGFMLDTGDTIPYLEDKDPNKYAGSKDALAAWLKKLRAAYPEIVLVANGTSVLPIAAPYVDAYVTEGIFSTHVPDKKECRKTTREERKWRLGQVDAALKIARHPVFDVEYITPDQESLGRWAEKQSQKKGFHPYVTTKELNTIL